MSDAGGQQMGETAGRRRRLIPIILLVIAAGVLAYVLFGREEEDLNVVRASGTIEAIEVDVSPRVSGRIVRLTVDEGDTVKQGQAIATLESAELQAQVEQARGNLATAKARLADLLAGTREEQIRAAEADYQRALANAQGAQRVLATVEETHRSRTDLAVRVTTARTELRTAQRERDAARANLELVRQGPRAEERERLRANLEQAQAQLVSAEEDYRRAEQLFRVGAVAAQQLDTARAARDTARGAVAAAQASYQQALAGSRPEEISAAQARLEQAEARVDGAQQALAETQRLYRERYDTRQQVETARANLQTAEAQVRASRAQLDLLRAGATAQAIEAARGQVTQAEGALAQAEAQLGHTKIVAPVSGVVLSRIRELGEYVTPGTPIVRMANLDRVWLRVYAPLPTLGAIKIGQTATVTTDVYGGKVYTGKVVSIAEEPEFTPRNVQTTEERVKLVYAIRIDIDNKERELKPGMPADAVLRIEPRGHGDS